METRLKPLGVVFAVAVCAGLVVGAARAQEEPARAGSDPGAASGGSAAAGGAAGGVAKGGSDAKGSDAAAPADNRIAGQGARGDAGRTGAPVHAGPGPAIDANRKGGAATGAQGPVLSHGINLTTPDSGYAGLLRRANRTSLIAAAARKPTGALAVTGPNPAFGRSGADGGIARNAVGLVVPGTGAGHMGAGGAAAGGVARTAPGFMAHAGTGTSASVAGAGATGMGSVGVDIHRPAPLLNAATGPAAHMAVINGAARGPVSIGPSSVGGPAKDHSGINGTTLRLKH
jgi:hypothetical protein